MKSTLTMAKNTIVIIKEERPSTVLYVVVI